MRRALWSVAAGWVGFVVATAHWMPWGEPIARQYATDERQYEAIAHAAPGLPSRDAIISAAASQRLGAHWLVGVLADATGLGLHTVYRIVTFACLLVIVATIVRIVEALELPLVAGAAVLGLVIGNPYAFRLPLLAPAMLSDVLVVLGSAVALLGLVRRRPWVAIAGASLAVVGREGGLAVAAVVGGWLLVRERDRRGWIALVLPAALFAGAKAVGEQFAVADPSVAHFTVVTPLLRLPDTAHELVSHFGRVVLASPVALALLAAGFAAAPSGRRLVARAGIPLLLAAALALQPAAFNPDWVINNESRLAALAIVPLAVAAGIAYASVPAALTAPSSVLVIAAVALASLHHRYTWASLVIGPDEFVACAAVCALVVLGVVWLRRPELSQDVPEKPVAL